MSALAKPLDRLSHVIGEMVVDFGIHSDISLLWLPFNPQVF